MMIHNREVSCIALFAFATLAASGRDLRVHRVQAAADQAGIRIMAEAPGVEAGAAIWLGGKPLATERLADGRLTAVASPAAAPGGLAVVQVRSANGEGSALQVVEVDVPGAVVSARAAGRFLEQASWGPTPASLVEVRRMGLEKWIDAQFEAPISDYPEPSTDATQQSMTPVQRRFFYNCFNGADQLRQRMAFALHQIWVVSATKTTQAQMMIPYLRVLQANAFSNYHTLMREMTLNPAMGRYLDMVNNVKPDRARGIAANENYAREIMQLFTVGTVKLNVDGTAVLDENGRTIPTYDQSTIENLALVFTGWTFPPTPGRAPAAINPAYYFGRMVPWEANHDTSAKTLIGGYTIPAGRAAQQELDDALQELFDHPNVGPFVARRLIGALVTSNPSPAYVARVASAFNSGSGGVRGDLKAVAKAILLDPEARQGDNEPPPPTFGHLREPVLYVTSILRALNANVAEANGLAGRASAMGQNPFFAPTVFNYFNLMYQVPGQEGIAGPEYEILTPANALARANFVDLVAFQRLGPTVTIDLVPLVDLATVHKWYLSEALNRMLFHGRMPETVRDRILIALDATTDPATQVQIATYLAASSMLYQVQN
jgi:uncharacterized protein (DUF1800 family)